MNLVMDMQPHLVIVQGRNENLYKILLSDYAGGSWGWEHNYLYAWDEFVHCTIGIQNLVLFPKYAQQSMYYFVHNAKPNFCSTKLSGWCGRYRGICSLEN